MGRKKLFDEKKVIKNIGKTFIKYGYEGTSLDDLVKTTGVLRGSLYSTFGSKHGMFMTALRDSINTDRYSEQTLSLITIAMMELTRDDKTTFNLVRKWVNGLENKDLISVIGKTVIERSQILRGEENGK